MNLDNLPEDSVKENSDFIAAYLREAGIDASPGTALGEVLVKPCAMLFTGLETSFNDVMNNLDIQTASDMYAALLLSNYGLSVQTPGPGRGYILLLTESEEDLVVRGTTSFSAGNYTILLSRDYIGTTSYSDVSSELYVPLLKYDDTRYYMLIEGETSSDLITPLLPGTAVTPSKGVTGLSSSEIATSFVPARSARTLDDLKQEVANGVSAKVLGGPAHIKALLEESDELPVLDTSVVGMNDVEMLRDGSNIYGASSGGYSDIYVRTSPYPFTLPVSVEATPLGGGRFRALISSDKAPGFYYIKSVSYGTMAKTYDIGMFEYTAGVDTSMPGFVPFFPDSADARFSAFQNCSVEFSYDGVPEDDTSPSFVFDIVCSPEIKKVQEFVSDPERRTPGTDYAVKAFVPVFVSIELNVSYNPSGSMPDTARVAEVVADAVNRTPLGQGFLSGAVIAGAVSELYPDALVKLPVIMDAFLIDRYFIFHKLRSLDTLKIPDMPEQGVTGNTASFVTNPASISVTLTGDKK